MRLKQKTEEPLPEAKNRREGSEHHGIRRLLAAQNEPIRENTTALKTH